MVETVTDGGLTTARWSGLRSMFRAPSTLAHRVVDAACRSSLMLRLLFGVRLPRGHDPAIRFDVATYVLSRHLQPFLAEDSHVLDMGTGPAATLGLFLWRRTGCSVTCVDVHGAYVTSARQVVAHNGAPLEVLHSDLFDEVRGLTDTVIFNPPYVPTSTGHRRGLRADSRSQWDGGADGTEVIQMFLVAVAGWGEALRAHVGVNRRHVATRRIVELIEAVPSLRLEAVAAHRILPVTVFTFHNGSAVVAT